MWYRNCLHIFSKFLFGWEPQVSVSDVASWLSGPSVCFGFFCYNDSHIFGLVLIHDMGMNLLSGSKNECRPCFILLIMSLYSSYLLSLTFYIIKCVVYVCESQHRCFHKIFQVKDRQRSRNTEIIRNYQNRNGWQRQHKATGQRHLASSFSLIWSGPKSVNPISVHILLTG